MYYCAGSARTRSMHIRLDENVHAADSVEGDLDVFVVAPVAHPGEVFAVGGVFVVAWVQEKGSVRQ